MGDNVSLPIEKFGNMNLFVSRCYKVSGFEKIV